MNDRSYFVLVYDIAADKRRLKIAKAMESVGERVQYSVFEAWLTETELQKVLKRVKKVLNEKEDSLRIYRLCETCRAKVQRLGVGGAVEPPGVMIV